ncbi:unnamed protein product, partial [Ilex paraguariensis]
VVWWKIKRKIKTLKVLMSGSYSYGESLEYEYFYDNECNMHDDELYDTFVDHDVEFVGVNKEKRMEEDKGVAKGKRMEKGKGVAKGEKVGDRGTIMQDDNDFYGEEYDTDELVSLGGSSLEGEEGGKSKVKYPHFNARIDMVDPPFKL